MKDETYAFVQDVKQRGQTARSARNRRTHNGRGGSVKLPSDYMTRKELNAMNGKVESYRLNDPMKWAEFKSMPDDIKETYIKLIREKFGVPDSAIAEMLGIHRVSLCQEIKRLGIGKGKEQGGKYVYDQEKWLAWSKGVPVAKEIAIPETHIFAAPETHEECSEAVPCKVEKVIPNHGIIEFNSPAADALDMVKSILGDTNVKITISWEVDDG